MRTVGTRCAVSQTGEGGGGAEPRGAATSHAPVAAARRQKWDAAQWIPASWKVDVTGAPNASLLRHGRENREEEQEQEQESGIQFFDRLLDEHRLGVEGIQRRE